MNFLTGKWVKAAVICLVVGIIAILTALILNGFDFRKFNTENFEMKVYTVQEKFKNIELDSRNFDIRLVKSTDNKCSVSCAESSKTDFEVSVENDTLKVQLKDRRKWYEHIGFGFWYGDDLTVTVFLPEDKYGKLDITTVSGDIDIPSEFKFSEAKVKSTSGDISFKTDTDGDLTVVSISGDITLESITCEKLAVQSTSGEIYAAKCLTRSASEIITTCGDIELTDFGTVSSEIVSTSGEVEMNSFTADENVSIKTVSGDIEFDSFDSESLYIKSTSGYVEGNLLTPKRFKVTTTSGDVHVPPDDDSAGDCEIKTTSGDINIKIK